MRKQLQRRRAPAATVNTVAVFGVLFPHLVLEGIMDLSDCSVRGQTIKAFLVTRLLAYAIGLCFFSLGAPKAEGFLDG